jgi:hypothetical protein
MAKLDPEFAHRLAQRLKTIPECPQSNDAIEAMADDLRKHCADEAEAEWLVSYARDTWEKWRGTRGLLDALETRRPQLPASNQAIDYGPKPAVECERCNDWGHVTINGKLEFCACNSGDALRAALPAFCDRVPPRSADILRNPPPGNSRKITQADIDAAVRKNKERLQ